MPPRILCYAVNGLGLGHLTRVLAVARQLRTRSPEAEILILTSNEAEAFCFREGFAAVKVPSRSARDVGRIHPSRHVKLVQSVTWNLVSAFDPHLLLVDSFPAGAVHELLPLLRWPMRRVFLFREMQPSAAADPYFQNVLSQYHLAILPHDPGEVPLPLPATLPACAVGPILLRDRGDALPRDAARCALGADPARLVCYVNFGGGGDPASADALESALAALAAHPEVQPIVAPGPLATHRPLGRSGMRTVSLYPIAPYFSGVDLALSAAGYNTHAELLHFGVPSAFLPVPKGLDDQAARVARSATRGACVPIHAPTREAFADALMELLDDTRRARLSAAAREAVPRNGAGTAAEQILELLR